MPRNRVDHGCAAFMGLLFTLALTPVVQGQVLYSVVNLRARADQWGDGAISPSRPEFDGLNENGDVVGRGSASGTTRPFYYRHETGAVVNLGDLEGDFGGGGNGGSWAYSVNDAGWVVGYGQNGQAQVPFLWRDLNENDAADPGEMVELALNPGATFGSARVVNNLGQVLIGGNGLYRWTDANGDLIVDADELLMISASGQGYAMDEAGNVLWNEDDAYRWIDADGDDVMDAGEVAVIPDSIFSGSSGSAYDMNNLGQVVGYARNPAGDSRGYRWTDANHNNVVDSGEVVDLGHPAGTNFFAWGINDAGQVVGGLAFGSTRLACVWDDTHGLRNLNDLVDPCLGAVLHQAMAINNRGQIVAYGRIPGQSSEYAFLLTPIDGPGVAPDLDRDGDVDRDDLLLLAGCATGPGLGPVAACCERADLDTDGDVDQSDFGLMQRCFAGRNVSPDPDCME